MSKQKTYCIMRFFQDADKDTQVIERGLSLEEAQAHCNRDDTHGDGWFDGYVAEQAEPEFKDHVETCPVCQQAVFNPQ